MLEKSFLCARALSRQTSLYREEKVWLCGVSACAGGIISLEEQQILFSVCERVHLLMCVLLYN